MVKTWQENRDAHEAICGPIGPVVRHELMQAEIDALRAELDAIKAQEPVATMWREKNQKLYPGAVMKLTKAGEALPLGVEHYLYASPQPAPEKQEPTDGCTESNCLRCHTHPALRGDMPHAGIGSYPAPEKQENKA